MTDAPTGTTTTGTTTGTHASPGGHGTRHPEADRAHGSPPARPVERYGRRGARGTRLASRWTAPLLAVLVVAAGLAVAATTYRNLGRPGITGTVTAFDTAEDHVDVRFVVVRDRPDRAVTCTLRARSRQGEEVGRTEIAVAPGADRVNLDRRLPTTARPVTGELVSCRYDG